MAHIYACKKWENWEDKALLTFALTSLQPEYRSSLAILDSSPRVHFKPDIERYIGLQNLKAHLQYIDSIPRKLSW